MLVYSYIYLSSQLVLTISTIQNLILYTYPYFGRDILGYLLKLLGRRPFGSLVLKISLCSRTPPYVLWVHY